MIGRRKILAAGASALAGSIALGLRRQAAALPAPGVPAPGAFEVTKTEAEWRQALTPLQFSTLRRHGTEAPFSSPLDAEWGKGVYDCAGCARAVFSSADKFDSGTGWPSFTRPIPGAVQTSEDRSLGMIRTEVHCGRCGGHLGHVFDDGPKPTGQRWCINGAALRFRPA
jgi:peptide-methionine (R)-S-oxide reductase